MDFKNLGENGIVHIIRKKPFAYLTGVLKSKSVKNPNPYQIQPAPQTFDLVISVGGNDEVVPGIGDGMEVVDYKGSYYSASPEGTLQAVTNMMQMAQNGIDEQSYYHSVKSEGEKVLELLNPQYAEGKRQARIIKDLQDRTDEQDKKLDKILTRLDEFFSTPKK